jgi:hypothetical protein
MDSTFYNNSLSVLNPVSGGADVSVHGGRVTVTNSTFSFYFASFKASSVSVAGGMASFDRCTWAGSANIGNTAVIADFGALKLSK